MPNANLRSFVWFKLVVVGTEILRLVCFSL